MNNILKIPFSTKKVDENNHTVKVLDFFPEFIVNDIYVVTQANTLNRIRKHNQHDLILIGERAFAYLRIYDENIKLLTETQIYECIIYIKAKTIFSLRFEELSSILVLSNMKHDRNEIVYFDCKI